MGDLRVATCDEGCGVYILQGEKYWLLVPKTKGERASTGRILTVCDKCFVKKTGWREVQK